MQLGWLFSRLPCARLPVNIYLVMNARVLISAIVQRHRAIAQLATTGGPCAPLAQVAGQASSAGRATRAQAVIAKVSADSSAGFAPYPANEEARGRPMTPRGAFERCCDASRARRSRFARPILKRFGREDESRARGAARPRAERARGRRGQRPGGALPARARRRADGAPGVRQARADPRHRVSTRAAIDRSAERAHRLVGDHARARAGCAGGARRRRATRPAVFGGPSRAARMGRLGAAGSITFKRGSGIISTARLRSAPGTGGRISTPSTSGMGHPRPPMESSLLRLRARQRAARHV